ncbi:FAD binding domain-containing protein [Poronia punctata]|nr:FAD binding domain-containing protein [Poronia punctata]
MGSIDRDYVVTNVDFLVVGAGPAGASLAAFLGQNGLKGVVIAKAPGTANTPRAHIFNPFALETLRDIGLEGDALGHGTRGDSFKAIRWSHSMIGEEYGKVRAWGGNPKTQKDIATASPCEFLDLPQSYLEPILVRYASTNGFKFKFSTELVDVAEIPGSTDSLCTVRDLVSQHIFHLRVKYVFGADGARSRVAKVLDLPFHHQTRKAVAVNIIFRCELSHLMLQERWSGLHNIIQPQNLHGMVPIMRVVRPWNEWILVCVFPEENDRFKNLTPESPELIELVHQIIGDDTVDVKVHRLDPWTVQESVALKYSVEGRNLWILGDAAHRHPPAHGNGSNTCLQDAYNLAWKVAFVSKGYAGRKLLDTYNVERQPAGATLVREANQQMEAHAALWETLGVFAPTPEEGVKALAELKEPGPEGDKRRKQLHDALEEKNREAQNIGLSYNQWYDSTAVYLADETEPRPQLVGDPIVDILISTYPGNRLPHAWLDIPTRRRKISTHDLAGHGAFCLFVGYGGTVWREAATAISKATGIPINTYAIGWSLDYIDVYRDWYKIREVEEDGCVLVRPDRFIAWRSRNAPSDVEGKLRQVLDSILSRDELQS